MILVVSGQDTSGLAGYDSDKRAIEGSGVDYKIIKTGTYVAEDSAFIEEDFLKFKLELETSLKQHGNG